MNLLMKDEFPDSFKDFLKRTRDIALVREQLTRDLNNSKSKIFNTYNLNPKKEHEVLYSIMRFYVFCYFLLLSYLFP